MSMTNEEWTYHRSRAVEITSLGLCSKTKTGLIKTEGHAPAALDDVKKRITHLSVDRYKAVVNQLERLM